MIGNMTMEVGEGYDSVEDLNLLYSTFGKPRKVESFVQGFRFSETLQVKSNLFLMIYGAVGGFFGVIIALWFCYCCIFRCLYVWFVKRFDKKEKRLLPVLRKRRQKSTA